MSTQENGSNSNEPQVQEALPPPKKKSGNYFDHNTQLAIIDFQSHPDIEEKKKIFVERIRPAFEKLIENIINVYRFNLGNLDVHKNDCMSFLFENLYKWDANKGSLAFSYFNVICKNWFVQKTKGAKKRAKTDVHFDRDLLFALEHSNDAIQVPPHEDTLLGAEYMTLLKEEIASWRKKLAKKQEKLVLEAVIHLMENPDRISLYNKKAVYLYIREITGLNTKQIVTNLSKLRRRYTLFKKRYQNGDI